MFKIYRIQDKTDQRVTRQTLSAIEAAPEVITSQIEKESETLSPASSPENSMIKNKIEGLESKIRRLNEDLVRQRILTQQLEARMNKPIQQLENRMEDKAEKTRYERSQRKQ